MNGNLWDKPLAPNPRVAVVGSGAIGCFYGAKLQRAGCDVHFLMRSDLAHVREHGLKILSHDGDFDLPRVQAHGSTGEIGPVDLVLVALKATQNTVLPDLLPALIGPATAVLTFQNGVGNEEALEPVVGASRILGGVCFVCLNRIAPGVVKNIRHGAVEVAEFGVRGLTPRLESLAALWERAGISCKASPDLVDTRWRKLVWNVPFNGLSIALGGVTTDRILQNPEWAERVVVLMREVQAGAAVLGAEIPDDFLRHQVDRTPEMGAYRPSSLIDWEAGLPVEVEAIWAEPLRRAEAAGACLPEWGRLVGEITERF
jgi:2-dehydropantoate 2-reductase